MFLPRDKFGALIPRRDTLPEFVRDNLDDNGQWSIKSGESFMGMYATVKRLQGLDREEIAEAWQTYATRDPALAATVRGNEPMPQPGYGGTAWRG